MLASSAGGGADWGTGRTEAWALGLLVPREQDIAAEQEHVETGAPVMQGDVQAQGRGCDARGRHDLCRRRWCLGENGVRIGFRGVRGAFKKAVGENWAAALGRAGRGSGGPPGGFHFLFFSIFQPHSNYLNSIIALKQIKQCTSMNAQTS